MSRLAAALLAAFALAAPLAATAQSGRPAAAKKAEPLKLGKIFPYYETYLRIPAAERNRFQLAYFLMQSGRPAGNLPVFAVDGGVRTPIAVAPDGRMTPPSIALLRSKTAVASFPANSAVNVQMSLLPAAAPATEMNAADLAASVEQANRAIKRAAGVVGFAVPRMGQVKFMGAGSGHAVLADGGRAPLPVVEGAPVFQPASLPNARTIVLARAPSRALLGPAAKLGKR